jgi:hypothetical protein
MANCQSNRLLASCALVVGPSDSFYTSRGFFQNKTSINSIWFVTDASLQESGEAGVEIEKAVEKVYQIDRQVVW